MIGTAAILVYTAEILKQFSLLIQMSVPVFLMNLIIVLSVEGIWYFVFGKVWEAGVLTVLTIDAFSIVNYFVMIFRGRPIYPVDLFSVGTALDVAGSYSFAPPRTMIAIVLFHGCWLAGTLLASKLLFKWKANQDNNIRRRIGSLTLSLVCLWSIGFSGLPGLFGITAKLFSGDTNGLLLNFLLSIQVSIYEKPDGYSSTVVERILDRYSKEEQSREEKSFPNLVVIMNESFADLSIWSDSLEVSTDPMPFYHNLQKNAGKGYALSSVWGGNTANSEFEFLTGNSMYFLPAGSVPYQLYMKGACPSLVSHLKELGYETAAIHPGWPDAWNRENVYCDLGFDQTYYKEDWKWQKTRTYESDESCYELIQWMFSQKSSDKPLFLFNVTIQNHAGYLDPDYQSTVSIANFPGKYQDVEQYLSLVRESDAALQQLIEYFETIDEEVVVLFFGDHQPKLDDEFVQEMLGEFPENLKQEDLDKLYYVPYLIWTNYESDVRSEPFTSINYLSNLLLKTAGIPYARYNYFLEDAQSVLPVLSAVDCVKTEKFSNEQEEAFLKEYEMLVYDNLSLFASETLWR